jgi:hypothetical protein
MSQSTQEQSIVAVYDSHAAAEGAIKALLGAGIDTKELSIIGKDLQTEEHALGFYTANDRIKLWGGRGAFWGGLWGLLVGAGVFFIPGIGPLVVMGPLVGWIVGALEGAAVGGAAGVLAAALAGIGIPKDSIVSYEHEVKTGRFLVLARGSAASIETARAVLGATGATRLDTHASCAMGTTIHAEGIQYVTRDSILKMLSEEEVDRVSTSETAARLSDGDEYVDLEQLGRGVQRASGAKVNMGHVLPRKAVLAATWDKIVTELAASRAATELVEV